MADRDIQKSQHLLKSLENDMLFLKSLVSQSSAVIYNLNRTWTSLDNIQKNLKQELEH